MDGNKASETFSLITRYAISYWVRFYNIGSASSGVKLFPADGYVKLYDWAGCDDSVRRVVQPETSSGEIRIVHSTVCFSFST